MAQPNNPAFIAGKRAGYYQAVHKRSATHLNRFLKSEPDLREYVRAIRALARYGAKLLPQGEKKKRSLKTAEPLASGVCCLCGLPPYVSPKGKISPYCLTCLP